MKKKVIAIIVASILSMQSFNAHAFKQVQADIELYQVLEEAKRFCKKTIDPMISQMAKKAGYDIETLCKSLNQLSQSADKTEEFKVPDRLPNTEKNQPLKEYKNQNTPIEHDNLPEQINPFEYDDLKLFGHDLFAGEPETFQPNSNAPVEPDYPLGPGDHLSIQLYGKVNDFFEHKIQRDGSIIFPKIGPIGVAGMSFIEATKLINRRVAEEYIGVKVSVSLGALRAMQIFVFGEAYKPGRYTMPALSTITNALYLSGGVTEIASLRNIQIKRDGKIHAVFDLYDLLLHGDRSSDIRLQSGDTIFIPTIGETASIQGQIRRPAIYEMKTSPTIKSLIEIAGGLLPKAFETKARIKRVDHSGFMTIVDVDLKTKEGLDTPLKNGDLLVIDAVADESNNTVTLSGNVYHPGEFLWREGLRVKDVIPSIDHLRPNADLNFSLLRRTQKPSGTITTLYLSLADIFSETESPLNYVLQPKDEIIIFGAQEEARADDLAELVMQLKQQSRINEIAKVVSISGAVQSQGNYPMTENMQLTQLIAFAGGLKEHAYNRSVEITRSDFSGGKEAVLSRQIINIAAILSGDSSDIRLYPHDHVNIRTLSDYRDRMSITISGEILFPGKYSILKNETLSKVIARAGGLKKTAHIQAAVFRRETLREREMQKIELLRDQVQANIASINLRDGKSISKESERQILGQLDKEKAIGRLVIDLGAIIEGRAADIVLRDGDTLIIPEFRQEVSIMGEVPWPSSHQYNESLKVKDYLKLAGGPNSNADKAGIYIVKVNGSVRIPEGRSWSKWANYKIEPGDTLVVPMDMDQQTSLSLWSELTRIIYQLSLGAAALKNL